MLQRIEESWRSCSVTASRGTEASNFILRPFPRPLSPPVSRCLQHCKRISVALNYSATVTCNGSGGTGVAAALLLMASSAFDGASRIASRRKSSDTKSRPEKMRSVRTLCAPIRWKESCDEERRRNSVTDAEAHLMQVHILANYLEKRPTRRVDASRFFSFSPAKMSARTATMSLSPRLRRPKISGARAPVRALSSWTAESPLQSFPWRADARPCLRVHGRWYC